MAGIDVSVSKEQLLPGLLGSQDGLAKLVEAVLKQVLEAPVTEALGAERHERAEERTGYRNGEPVRNFVCEAYHVVKKEHVCQARRNR